MNEPVFCGRHQYMGFAPCPRCNNWPRAADAKSPVILNGERVKFSIETKNKPWGWPWWLWDRLCKFVVRHIQITAETVERKP